MTGKHGKINISIVVIKSSDLLLLIIQTLSSKILRVNEKLRVGAADGHNLPPVSLMIATDKFTEKTEIP